MNILILGNSEDVYAAHLQHALTQAGATVDYFDTRLFPTQLRMFWQPDTQVGGLSLPGRRIKLAQFLWCLCSHINRRKSAKNCP